MKHFLIAFALLFVTPAFAQQQPSEIRFQSVPDFLKLPSDLYLGEATGVAVNSQGHVFVFSRGSTTGPAYGAASAQLLEFAPDGKFIREIGHHLSIDSAAVVASVLAVIVVEAILKESKVDWVWWFLALTLVIGSFAAIQVFGRKSLDRFSVAMTIGLGGAALAESLMEPRTFGFLEQYSVWISEHVHLGISIGTGVALALVCWSLYPRFKKE